MIMRSNCNENTTDYIHSQMENWLTVIVLRPKGLVV